MQAYPHAASLRLDHTQHLFDWKPPGNIDWTRHSTACANMYSLLILTIYVSQQNHARCKQKVKKLTRPPQTDRRLRPRCCHLGSYHAAQQTLTARRSPERPLPVTGIRTLPAKSCLRTSLPQPGGDFEQLQLMCKYDVIHKTGNT